MSDNSFKLKDIRFRWDMRKFFTITLELPRAVADDSSWEVFKVRLDGALSNLSW